MANVNDTNSFSRQLENAIQKIEEADTTEEDKEAMRAYAKWKKRRAKVRTATIYIRGVVHSADRHSRPIIGVDEAMEVEDIISAHEAAGCKKAKSINSKLTALRDFWRWCEGTEYGVDDYRWVELVQNVEPSEENPGVEPLDPEVILSEDEVSKLRDASRNYRDKALIEFLFDTGARITLATQMKRGDVNLERQPPTFRPNPDGIGHKGVGVKDFVLHESTRHLRLYLNEAHPDDHEDAPLWALERGYNPADRVNGAMSRRSAFDRLVKAAEAAGIEAERAHPHNIRKSAVVRMRLKHDMSWDAIQKRMEWTDVALPKMKEVYRAIENEDEIEMVARELGYARGSGEEVEELQNTKCWNCGREISSADDFCRGCGVSTDEAEAGRAVDQEFGALKLLAQLGEIDLSVEEVEDLASDPEARAEFIEARASG